MRGCRSSTSLAVLVNGSAKGWVKASRGLRQGDPLSHFLFTLVVDILSRLMFRIEEKGLTEGFFVGRNRTRVSILQFADSLEMISFSFPKPLRNICRTLRLFFWFLDNFQA